MSKKQEPKKLELDKFQMKKILPDSIVLVIGKRRSGKSFLIRDLFYHRRNIPCGIIFSGTEDASPFFSDFVPDAFIHSEYDSDLMKRILLNQKRQLKKSAASGKGDRQGKSADNNFFIVLDDMLASASTWNRDESIKQMFLNGRHYNIMGIISMQYALGIPPTLRNNIDYVFIFNEPSIKNRKKIYEDYCSMIPDFNEFCNILDECTSNYECLVVKTTGGNSNKLKDQVFWYKAEPHTNFKVGHPSLWKYHKNQYNNNYDNENDKFQDKVLEQQEKYGSNTNKLKVYVGKNGNVSGHSID